mmetsp:Transcript_33207/g.105658  ORF Transcript_33207/g.105658 Transcript_33207/m.105658 type:complete len:136 (+) Transcript_33207:79-486(+)
MLKWADMTEMGDEESMDLGAKFALQAWNSDEGHFDSADFPHDSELSVDLSSSTTTQARNASEKHAKDSENSDDKAASEAAGEATTRPGSDARAGPVVKKKGLQIQNKRLVREMRAVETSSPATLLGRPGEGTWKS